MRFVLLHSALVGPSTWRPVAEVLLSTGHHVTVPDLRGAATTGQPQAVIDAAVGATATDSAVVVGHSGAGFFLPSIADRLASPARRLVFVDAGIPPCEGPATASADFLDQLRSLAVNGVLPRGHRQGDLARLAGDRASRDPPRNRQRPQHGRPRAHRTRPADEKLPAVPDRRLCGSALR